MLKSIFYLNQQGRRSNIEDSIYPFPENASASDKLFVVCDGVGGESKGEEASRIVCESVPAYFQGHPTQEVDRNYVHQAIGFAIDQMNRYVKRDPGAQRMSTTLTMCYLESNSIVVAWCGDSRVYHFRDGEILWKTTDHSLVAQLVKQGEITEEEARVHPKKNYILRSLNAGANPNDVEIHFISDFKEGDHILLCTDGVLEQGDDDTLKRVIYSGEKDKRKLFYELCEGKTSDNYSFYLIEIGEGAKGVKSMLGDEGKKKKKGSFGRSMIAILLVIVLAGAAWYFGMNRNATVKSESVVPEMSTGSERNEENDRKEVSDGERLGTGEKAATQSKNSQVDQPATQAIVAESTQAKKNVVPVAKPLVKKDSLIKKDSVKIIPKSNKPDSLQQGTNKPANVIPTDTTKNKKDN